MSAVPKRFALLVGVDFYQNDKTRRLPNNDPVSLGHLEGAVNDIKFFQKLLQSRYQFKSVCTLTSSASLNNPSVPIEPEHDWPTHANIKGAFENIYNKANSEDIFFFQFSGYGASLKPAPNSPKDGRMKDLSLITADYCCGRPAIRGWELNEWLWRFLEKGVRVIVLLDSCYSGGAWRTGSQSRFRSPENWTPPPNLPADEAAVQGLQRKLGHRDGELDICWDLNPRDFTLMTACQNTEKAAEQNENGIVYGAFTLALIKYLQDPSNPPAPTYYAICDHTTNQLALWNLSQIPQVFGQDRLAFLEDYEPSSATLIFGELKDGIVSLPVGKVHGINKGSEFITVLTGFKTIFSISELYDLESKTKIVKGSAQNLSQSIRVIPYRWSSEKTLNIIMDPELKRSFREMVISHLRNRITGNIQYTKGTESTENKYSKAAWFRLGVKEDGGIEIFGPKQVLGYQGPVRGWKTSGGTNDERAKESAIALAHLFRFGQIVHLQNKSEDAAPFQVTVNPQPGKNTMNVLDVLFQNNGDKELYFAVVILSPGFHVKQLFPTTDTLQAVLPGGRSRVSFFLTVPAELKHDKASDQQHGYRDIVRTVVTRGRNLSLKNMELPDIWNADQGENKRTRGLARDANLLDPFSWWIRDYEATIDKYDSIQLHKLEREDLANAPDQQSKDEKGEAESNSLDPASTTEDTPSLTSATTIKTARTTKLGILQPPATEDTISAISALDSSILEQEKKQIVQEFAAIMVKMFIKEQIRISPNPIPQTRGHTLFCTKLEQYSKSVTDNTPRTVEYKRRRNAAKAVFWHRYAVADVFVRTLLGLEEEISAGKPQLSNRELPDYHERVSAWRESVGLATESDDAMTSTNTWDGSDNKAETDTDMDFEDVEQDQSHITTIELQAIRNHLMNDNAFQLLECQVQDIVRHYYSDNMQSIQSSILGVLDALSDVQVVEFFVKWDIKRFIYEQYGSNFEDLKYILAVIGNCQDAQMTTIGCYMEQTWPSYSSYLVEYLQNLVSGSLQQNSTSKGGGIITGQLTKEGVRLRAHGSSEFVCVIGQQLAWLGAVCRPNQASLNYSDTIWIHENPKGPALGPCRFTIDYEIREFDDDEPRPCWHSLVGKFAVATGFPIPERRSNNRGLQIPTVVMAALMGVSVAVDTGSGFILRGDKMTLTPVAYSEGRVQWHLAESKEGQQTMVRLDEKTIRESIGFLGWTPEVVNIAGTTQMDYSQILPSGAHETPHSVLSLTGVTLSFSRMGGVSIPFTISRKQYNSSKREPTDYDDVLEDLRSRNAILYDTRSQRGWHIDAERAVLQIIYHRSKSRTNYIDQDGLFQMSTTEKAVRTAMKENERVKLRRAWHATKGEEIDVWFSAEVKEIRDIIMNLQIEARTEYNRCIRGNDRKVVGFDYKGLVESLQQTAMQVEMDDACGLWPKFTNDIGAVVLLAKSFPEVLSPRKQLDLCPRYRQLPSHKSYLAIEAKAVQQLMDKNLDTERLGRLTANNMFLIDSMITFTGCCDPEGQNCACRRIQGLGRPGKRYKNSLTFQQLFSDGAQGAFIFGKENYWERIHTFTFRLPRPGN